MRVLIIGGTRNLGHFLAHALLAAGHIVSVLNRGITRDELPADVERLRADRTDARALAAALDGRTFDVVVDNALYNGREADAIVNLLNGRVGRYIFVSTGQVYLVRDGIERPFVEAAYDGRLLPSPKPTTFAFEEWMYGMEKRHAEDRLAQAYAADGFPYTSLRLPMVNSERDHFHRLYNYILRIKDGGPILVPSTPNYPLRHIYAADVISAIVRLLTLDAGVGQAYNLSQDETVSLDEFLTLVGAALGAAPNIVRVRRDLLEANGFLPDCSPFSERWMSELDNTRGKAELGVTYTPLTDYLARLVAHYQAHEPPTPASYRRRHSERLLAMQVAQEQQ